MALDSEQADEHRKCGLAEWRGGPLRRRRRPTPRKRWLRHPGVGQERVLKLPGRRTGGGRGRRGSRRRRAACGGRVVSCRGMRCAACSGAPPAEEECGSDGSTHASGSHDHPSLPPCGALEQAAPRARCTARRRLAQTARARSVSASTAAAEPPALARRGSTSGSEPLAAASATIRQRGCGHAGGCPWPGHYSPRREQPVR